MAVQSAVMLKFGGRPNRVASTVFDTRPKTMLSNHKLILLLNKDSVNGENNTTAQERAGKNRSPGANQGPEARLFPDNRPDCFTSFWRANYDSGLQSPMVTDVVETATLCWIVVARSKSTNLAANSSARAQIIGNFGNALLRGTGLIFNGPTQIRAIAYDTTLGAVTADLTIPGSNSYQKWRIYCLKLTSGPGGLLSVENWSGDSVNNTPTGTTMTGGHDVGSGRNPIAVLGRVGGDYTEEADVCIVHALDAIPDAGQKVILLAQIREQMRLAAVTELDNSPDP